MQNAESAAAKIRLHSALCILPSYNDSSPMAEQPVPPPSRGRFRTLAAEQSIPIDADDLLVLARRYADQGMYDESIHLYEMAEKLKPGSVALRINLARVRDLKEQTSKAIELLEIAKLKTPNNYRPFEILARLYFSQGEWEVAHEEIQKARKLNPFDRGLAETSGRIEF